ncbi:hypothetical protein [Flaviflagellibacter deserti]|uniref:PsiF repeat-containing protein n=1 Tax=Flaviflagellibacter deserti TaxID=2267266 RepID=A0ABV9YYV0_9HYPH
MNVLISALFVCLAGAAMAQEGDTSPRQKAAPQEEAMWSCTTQVEEMNLQDNEQKKQWMMACLTGIAGTPPGPGKVPEEQQAKICTQQADYLKLSGGERDNWLKACSERNSKQPG